MNIREVNLVRATAGCAFGAGRGRVRVVLVRCRGLPGREDEGPEPFGVRRVAMRGPLSPGTAGRRY
ncbi:MAG TPA: hypothetical protein PLC19_07135, partial [Marmoricola sp.]|nr:hypothetical protein [Marmoricola sp.]